MCDNTGADPPTQSTLMEFQSSYKLMVYWYSVGGFMANISE